MRRIYLFLALLIAGLSLCMAQEKDGGKREKMFQEVLEFKMKYLAQEMDLSEAQKKKFYEVYSEMSQSRRECYGEAVKLDKEVKHKKDASEADYQKATEALNQANARWAEQEKIYNEKFSEFLSSKQIYKMKEGENTFRAKLDEMRQSRKKDHHKKHADKK